MKRLILSIFVLFVLIISVKVTNVSAQPQFFKYYGENVFVVPKLFNTFDVKEKVEPRLLLSNPFDNLVLTEEDNRDNKNEKSEIKRAPVKNNELKSEFTIINISENGFQPREIVIDSGQTIIWLNKRAKLSALVLGVREIVSMRSGFLAPGGSFSKEFPEPGKYTYVDGVVIGTTGNIVVK